MRQDGEATLLSIYIGEADKLQHKPLYTAIIEAARDHGLAGATAWRGLMAYGAKSVIHTSRLLDMSADLPIVVEIIDEKNKVEAFCNVLDEMFETADAGVLLTTHAIGVRRYLPASDAEK
jgi:hypothetical protein